jgi:hypothetical protein
MISTAKLNIWAAYVPPHEMTEANWDSDISANLDKRDMAREILDLRERVGGLPWYTKAEQLRRKD